METSESFANPLVILNPFANRGNMSFHRAVIRSRLADEKRTEYVETSAPGEAQERAMNAAKDGRSVIVVGGDGSVHEVVNGILASGRRVPLGIVPAGSGNDYACYTLKLPRDPAASIERALYGRLIDSDAGMVNGKYFVNSFSLGLDGEISKAAGRLKKWPLMSGERLYYAAALQQLLFGYHRCPWLKFSLDASIGDEAERHFVLIAVTNGPTYGGGFCINPTADHADGLFDICAVTHAPLLRALSLLPVVQKGKHEDEPEVTFYHARRIHIESQQPVTMQVDGEIGSATCFDAEILPGALWVRV
jgi:diacylglycerol kinase (ATP)